MIPGAHVPPTRTWYVEAGAPRGGDGTDAHPLNSLRDVQRRSRAGDTIDVIASHGALEGGIALKPRQRLIGLGRSVVTGLAPSDPTPTLANTTGSLHGDAVRLANDTEVRNLRFTSSRRGAVYGRNVSGVRVTGNAISGQNTSCTKGFLIPAFNAPTSAPGVGVPFASGLQNGWAAVQVDATGHSRASVVVTGNLIHDAQCADGIDVRSFEHATLHALVSHNRIRDLGQGEHFQSLLAIGTQASNHSHLRAAIVDNRERNLGTERALNAGPLGADSEGVFVNTDGPGRTAVRVSGNVYRNPHKLGGFSANGLELVTMGNGGHAAVRITHSSFTGSTGDVIEEGGLGTNATLTLRLRDVTASRSNGIGNTVVLPFNNGDCILAGSLGAGNDVDLSAHRVHLNHCANNGLSFGSNVVNGHGPSGRMSLAVSDSEITHNAGANLGIRNFTALRSLRVMVELTNLADSQGHGSGVSNAEAEDLGSTEHSVIDLGGGVLHSVGGNCLAGGDLAADVVGFTVSALHDWWGAAGPPAADRTIAVNGSLATRPARASAPPSCQSSS